MKTSTKFMTKLTSVVAAIGIAASMGASALAADTNANINITTALSNTAVKGNVDITNVTSASAKNVTEQLTTVLQGVAAGGDINLTDLSRLMGENVVKTGTTVLDSILTNNLTITNIADILGKNTGVGFTTGINNAAVSGDIDITNLINTFGSAENLQAAIQTLMSNTVSGGNVNAANLVQ